MKKLKVLICIFVGTILLGGGPISAYILDPALNHSIQGMNAYEKDYDSLMLNAVNSNTPGYKEIGMANVKDKKRVSNLVYYNFAQGPAIQSGGSLDFMIEGSGFFVLMCPWGNGYTRDGRFTLDNTGRLVTFDNKFPVMGENGEIYLTRGTVTISENGAIFMDNALVDVIKILDLQYPARLKSLNGSIFFFENVADEVYKETSYSIKKGYYEASNVNLTGQLSQIPVIKNVYDANTKSVKLILKSLNAGISIGNPQ